MDNTWASYDIQLFNVKVGLSDLMLFPPLSTMGLHSFVTTAASKSRLWSFVGT